MIVSSLSSSSLLPNGMDRVLMDAKLPEEQKIAEAARQFEAVLLRQMISQARQPMFEKENESSSHRIYEDMLNSHLAEAVSHAGGFGLARALETQLLQQNASPTPGPEAGSTPPTLSAP